MIVAAPLFLSSCMKYQYATLSSDLPENHVSEFVHESDSVKISYSFDGENCPVRISIENKLDVPLYIDWKRSAVIFKDQSYSYWKDKAILNATSNGSEIQWTPIVSTSNATISGDITRDEAVSFIPPRALKHASMLKLTPKFLDLPEASDAYRSKIATEQGPVASTEYKYSQGDSPMKYRSYLTLATDPAFLRPFTFENQFWVSEVTETMANPKSLKHNQKSNQFFNKKHTGYGGLLALLGIIGLAALAVQ
jgi:hypothetical protein